MAGNRETKSNETIISSSSISMFATSLANSEELRTEQPLRFWMGAKMSVRNFDVL